MVSFIARNVIITTQKTNCFHKQEMEKHMKNKQKIRKEVQIFRESVRKVVVMLSGKDIPVAERGSRAYVEYNKDGTPCMVNLPSLPDDATDGLMNAIRGFLDHEVAHLLFTDSKLAFKLLEKKDSPAFHLWNAVEDTFIERRMGEVFSGSKRNLVNTQRHVIEKLFVPKVDDALKALSRNPRDLFLKFLLMPALRAWAGQTPFIEFMEPYWAYVRDPVSKLSKGGVPAAVPMLMSTEDCIKLAGRISLALKEEMEKPEGESGHGDSEENDSPDHVGSEQPTKSNDESVSDKPGSDDETQEEEEPAPVNNSNEDNIKDKEEGSESDTDSSNANDSQPKDGDAHEDDAPATSGDGDGKPEGEEESDQSEGFGGFEGESDDNEPYNEQPESGSGGADDTDSAANSNDQQSTPGDLESDGRQEATQGDLNEEDGGTGEIPLDAAFKALEGTEVAPEQGMEEALNEVMANELKGVPKGSYRPYQRSYDFIGPIDEVENHLRKTHKAFGRIHLNRVLKNWRTGSGRDTKYSVSPKRKVFKGNIEDKFWNKQHDLIAFANQADETKLLATTRHMSRQIGIAAPSAIAAVKSTTTSAAALPGFGSITGHDDAPATTHGAAAVAREETPAPSSIVDEEVARAVEAEFVPEAEKVSEPVAATPAAEAPAAADPALDSLLAELEGL